MSYGSTHAPIPLEAVRFTGSRLCRPECVLTTRGGDLFASDARGGICHLLPSGQARIYAGASLDLPGPLHPNGFALDRDGSFIVAHLSMDAGGVYRLRRDGQLSPVLQELDGIALTATNFVLLDNQGRLWITVSTRRFPRTQAFRPDVADGLIVLLDNGHARVVADGLGFANEIRIDERRRSLYVVETYAKRLTRYALAPDGTLSERTVFAEFGPGEFPDGIALDADGAVWTACIVANRLVRFTHDGRRQVMLDDLDAGYGAAVEQAYRAGRMEKAHIDRAHSRSLRNISSLAFGGPDLCTVYLGVLLGDRLPTIASPIAGAPMVHWDWS